MKGPTKGLCRWDFRDKRGVNSARSQHAYNQGIPIAIAEICEDRRLGGRKLSRRQAVDGGRLGQMIGKRPPLPGSSAKSCLKSIAVDHKAITKSARTRSTKDKSASQILQIERRDLLGRPYSIRSKSQVSCSIGRRSPLGLAIDRKSNGPLLHQRLDIWRKRDANKMLKDSIGESPKAVALSI